MLKLQQWTIIITFGHCWHILFKGSLGLNANIITVWCLPIVILSTFNSNHELCMVKDWLSPYPRFHK